MELIVDNQIIIMKVCDGNLVKVISRFTDKGHASNQLNETALEWEPRCSSSIEYKFRLFFCGYFSDFQAVIIQLIQSDCLIFLGIRKRLICY